MTSSDLITPKMLRIWLIKLKPKRLDWLFFFPANGGVSGHVHLLLLLQSLLLDHKFEVFQQIVEEFWRATRHQSFSGQAWLFWYCTQIHGAKVTVQERRRRSKLGILLASTQVICQSQLGIRIGPNPMWEPNQINQFLINPDFKILKLRIIGPVASST